MRIKRLYSLLILVCMCSIALGQNITKLEYFIDTDPGFGSGTNVPITASPSLTDFSFNIPLSSLTNGLHTLSVRVQNANNKWSIVQNRSFIKLALPANISRVEYFIDTDPGLGSGTAVSFTPGTSLTNLTFDVPMTSLSDGYHTLFVRMKDVNNKWSIVQSKPFVKIPAKPNIVYIEYYIDTDPGQGNGTTVPFTPAATVTDLNFSVDVSALSQGNHKLFVRVKNASNRWSTLQSQDFNVCNLAVPLVKPAYEITDTSFKFAWDAVPGATSYDADLSANNFATFSTGHIAGTAALSQNLTPNTSYQYRVRAVNATCYSIYSAVFSVTTLNCTKPPKPTITLSNNNTAFPELTSSASAGNQWYKDDAIIPGATNSTLIVTDPGVYKVQVKSGDCISEFSDEVPLIITATEFPLSSGLVIYPNPVIDQLTIREADRITDSRVYDTFGREEKITFLANGNEHYADVKHLSPGVYVLMVQSGNTHRHVKFIKN